MEYVRLVIAALQLGEFLTLFNIKDVYLHISIFPPTPSLSLCSKKQAFSVCSSLYKSLGSGSGRARLGKKKQPWK